VDGALLLTSTFLGGGIFLLAVGLAEATSRPAWWVLAGELSSARAEETPSWREQFLARLGRTWSGRWLGRGEGTRRRLELAGSPVTAEVLKGIQVLVGGSCLLVFILIGLSFPPAFLLAPLACLSGLRAPEMIVARRAQRRQSRIAAAVPDLVELLLATTEAGLSPSVALQRSAEALSGPLGDEVRASVRQVELGTAWHQAIANLVDRTQVESLRALAVALNRSQRLGSGVGVTLRWLADDLRSERRLRAEEETRKAPLKMLFPLVFLVLPAFLLLTVGPVVLATIRALR
jgi:tight adherence protein C